MSLSQRRVGAMRPGLSQVTNPQGEPRAHGRVLCTVGTLLLVLAVGLMAAWPYLSNPGLPAGTDAELHVFRIAELGYSIQAGNLYPRWAPDFFYGYGYPIFNYYAPLTYHLGYWLTLGHPERAADAARLCFILAQVMGAAGAYALGSVFGKKGGGLLGALAFSLSPYIQIINPHIRGDLAESVGLAFLPWSLWAWEQLWRKGGRGYVLAAVLATSAVFLSHNLTGLTVVALAGSVSLWRWLASGRSGRRMRQALVAAAAFVLLTAFFWLPFLVERSAVRLDVAGDGHYDFRNHFVLLRELLAPLTPIDWRSATMAVPMTAGPVTVGLAIVGAAAAVYRRRFADTGYYIVAALGAGLLVLRVSQPIWEMVAPMAFYQFPWRFLGPLATLLVPLVAQLGQGKTSQQANLGPRDSRRPWAYLSHTLVPVAAAGAMLAAALPALYPTPWQPELGRIVPATIIEAELEGRWRGTTSTDDFVPSTVDMTPGPTESVVASYEQTASVDRVNRFTLPGNATVETLPSAPWVTSLDVTTPESFLLRLYLFDFPGWRATVDGLSVPIELARPEGFITLQVPAGSHHVELRFGTTSARSWSWALSALGLVLMMGAVLVTPRGQQRRAETHQTERTFESSEVDARMGRATVTSVGVVLVMFAALKILLFDPTGWFWIESPVGEVQNAQHQQRAVLSDEVVLLGYDLSTNSTKPGGVIEVTLYWLAQRPMTETYQSFVHLMYPEGAIQAQSDHLNPGGFPTNLWPTDRYIRDTHRLTIPADAQPGLFTLAAGMYTLVDGERLPVDAADCGKRPDSVILCQPIIVRR